MAYRAGVEYWTVIRLDRRRARKRAWWLGARVAPRVGTYIASQSPI